MGDETTWTRPKIKAPRVRRRRAEDETQIPEACPQEESRPSRAPGDRSPLARRGGAARRQADPAPSRAPDVGTRRIQAPETVRRSRSQRRLDPSQPLSRNGA